MRLTPETKQAIKHYILDAIDLDGYDQYKGIQMSEHDRLKAVFDIFKSEKSFELKRDGEQNAFVSWLQGLPSCFNIDFENWNILQLNAKWGFIPEPKQFGEFTKAEQKILDQWWARIYMTFHAMLTRPGKPLKIKTIDITALDWFDKVNGNSYFAGTVSVNYGMKNAKVLKMPFQYGYGDHYKTEALNELVEAGVITDLKKHQNGSNEGLRKYCERHKIILRTTKHENCKKAELKNL
jgi:hypothetical protein